MATYDFDPTFNDLVEEVCDLLQISQDGATLDAGEVDRLRKTYNFMVKGWQALGINLWTYQEGYLMLHPDQTKYTMEARNQAFNTVTLWDAVDGAVLAGNNTIDVDNANSFAANDTVGIFLADNTIEFATVQSVAAPTLTLTANLSNNVADNAIIFVYDSSIDPSSQTVFTNDLTWTTTTAAATTGANALALTSTTGFARDTTIGVYFEDGTVQYMVVAYLVGSTAYLTSNLTSDVAEGARIFIYDAVNYKPITRVSDCMRVDDTDRVVPLDLIDRKTYMRLPDKTTSGAVTTSYFDRQKTGIGGRHIFWVWPSPPDAKDYIQYSYERALQIVEQPTDKLDFPEYWYPAIIYNLAARSTLKVGAPAEVVQVVMNDAPAMLTQAQSFENSPRDTEITLNANG